MEQENGTALGTIFSICLLGAIIYFAWASKPAVEYFGSSGFVDGLNRSGGISALLGIIWGLMGALIVLVSGLLIAREFLGKAEPEGLTKLLTFLWPIAGWYVGHEFNAADSPKLAYIGFSLITLYMFISGTFWLLRFLFGLGAEKAIKNIETPD